MSFIFRPWCWLTEHAWVPASRADRAFLFCDRCAYESEGWQLTPTVAKGTRAPSKAKVLRFERTA